MGQRGPEHSFYSDPRAVSCLGFPKVQVMGLLVGIRVHLHRTSPCENGSFSSAVSIKKLRGQFPSQFNNCSCVQGLNSENGVPAPPECVIRLRE